MKGSLLSLLLLAAIPASARAQQCGQSFVAGFTDFTNDGNWVWTASFHGAMSTGGNPGYYVRSQIATTDRPVFATTDPLSIFQGDYRATAVTSLGIDLRTFDAPPSACDRPLSLVIETDNHTPHDSTDDRWVYTLTPNDVPCRGAGWRSYTVDVPSDSTTIPPGWLPDPGSTMGGNATWNLVIQNVTRLRWVFGDPTVSYPAREWVTGADNARIAWSNGPSSYCAAKINSEGCSAAIEWLGTPSASSSSPFLLTASQVINQQPGLLLYGNAPAEVPFQGGFLCVTSQIRRSPLLQSHGDPPPANCSGRFEIDFNARIQSGVDPLLVPGATVYAQF